MLYLVAASSNKEYIDKVLDVLEDNEIPYKINTAMAGGGQVIEVKVDEDRIEKAERLVLELAEPENGAPELPEENEADYQEK